MKFTMTWEESVDWLRKQPGQQELVRACFFDDPLLQAANRYWRCAEWQAVQKLVGKARGKALDVGAGRGIAAFALAKDGWQVTALEPDPSDLVGAGAIRNLARESELKIDIVQEWGESLPFEDESFDFVHARQVLHHARNLQQLCSELQRVLKKGGLFLATREHVIDTVEDLPVFLNSHPLHNLYGGENAYLLDEYLLAIHKAGIKMIKYFSPWESDLNLYPQKLEDVQAAVARELGFTQAEELSVKDLYQISRQLTTPGRLYSFFGISL